MAGKSPEELQRAVEIYQQELTKLQQKMAAAAKQEEDESKETKHQRPLGLPPPPPPPAAPPPSSKPAEERPLGSSPAVLAAASAPSPLPLPPAAPSAGAGGGDASPLQGMASITNSLTTQPLHAPYRPAQRSYKAVLPPITQEQFDRYDSLNTEDLVKRVSDSNRETCCNSNPPVSPCSF